MSEISDPVEADMTKSNKSKGKSRESPILGKLGNLPNELKDEIFQYIDATTIPHVLANLCCVNRYFHERYKPRLYSHIEVIRTTERGTHNHYNTDLICALSSPESYPLNASYVRSVSIVDQLKNNTGFKADATVLSLLCNLFKKGQIKEIYMSIDGIELDHRYHDPGNRKQAAAHIIKNQTEVEVIEWSMYCNDLIGYFDVDQCMDGFGCYRTIASTPRPALRSLKVSGFGKKWSSYVRPICSLKSLLLSAENLREFGFGLLSLEHDTAPEDDINRDVFSKEDPEAERLMHINFHSNQNATNASVTYELFKFIHENCKFKGMLTSLKLENASLSGQYLSTWYIRLSFDPIKLSKLVLLDCKGLSNFLEVLSPSDMNLEMLHLEFRIEDSNSVDQFVDSLPAGTLKDLALMQWGGGLTILSCLKSHAPFLRSLVLDVRQGFPVTERDEPPYHHNPERHRGYQSVPLEESNSIADLQELFSAMKTLQELGIPCSLTELSLSVVNYMHDKKLHYQEKDENPDFKSPDISSFRDLLKLDRHFLKWLLDAMLPRLHTFQLRSVRTPTELKNPLNLWIANAIVFSSLDHCGMNADATYLQSILPPTVRNIILGCKKPSQYYHYTPKLQVNGDIGRVLSTEREYTDRTRIANEASAQRRNEALYPALFRVRKGVKTDEHWCNYDGPRTFPVSMVLPYYERDAWRHNLIQMGKSAADKNSWAWEGYDLPQTWRDFGSSVYEAAWAR